jgi:hypothetical protein
MNRELYFATPIYVKDVGTPEFNAQLEQNIIMNGMVRGGEATRDFVRRNIQLEKTGSYYLH